MSLQKELGIAFKADSHIYTSLSSGDHPIWLREPDLRHGRIGLNDQSVVTADLLRISTKGYDACTHSPREIMCAGTECPAVMGYQIWTNKQMVHKHTHH
jgi:hypothetical protein